MELLIKNRYLLSFLNKAVLRKNVQIQEFWIHVIFWVCFLTVPISIGYTQMRDPEPVFFMRILLSPILVYINYLILVPKLLLKKKVGLYILTSLVVLVIFNISAAFILPTAPLSKFQLMAGKSGLPPLKNLPHAMMAITSLAFFLLGGILALTKDFYRRDRVIKEKEAHRSETELQFLRAQLNPHFLFNSLNSIYSLVRNKHLEAPEAVITLSELMRYMLYEARQELVPLDKEIQYIKNFVSLQLLRLSNSENVKLNISGNYNDKKISPLLLIPFVENAFKYGTDFKGVTYVQMKLEIVADHFFFFVRNKVGVYRRDESNSGIGLENIKHRLQLLYPEEHKLLISKDNGYYEVQLELNLS